MVQFMDPYRSPLKDFMKDNVWDIVPLNVSSLLDALTTLVFNGDSYASTWFMYPLVIVSFKAVIVSSLAGEVVVTINLS